MDVDTKKIEYDITNKYEVKRMFNYKPKSEGNKHAWGGYVALRRDTKRAKSGEPRDVVIAWRGSQTIGEWAKDALLILSPWEEPAQLKHWKDDLNPERVGIRARSLLEDVPAGSPVRVPKLKNAGERVKEFIITLAQSLGAQAKAEVRQARAAGAWERGEGGGGAAYRILGQKHTAQHHSLLVMT